MKLNIDVLDYTCVCRRAVKLAMPELANIEESKNINIVVDSTGLKIFGAGIWSEKKHGLKKRRQWRKLHLTIDRDSHAIIAQELTTNAESKDSDFGSRNHNVSYIEEHGSYCWQSHSDYNFRALEEVTMFRYKTIIGDKLYSRKLASQKAASRIACVILNKMTALGMPRSVKVKVAA